METLDGNCNHTGSLDNNCFVCGTWQEVRRRNRRRRDQQHMSIMETQRKLYLVLDLDHTLLNSTGINDITKDEVDYLKTLTLDNSLFVSTVKSTGVMMTKLRPFVRKFLKEVNEMFDMCIYTMGSRLYAQKMAKLLDPKGVYFSDRIISRDDCTVKGKKSLDVVIRDEKAVVIVDDSKNVWSKKHQSNLIEIERYHFFASSCKKFKQDSKSLSELKMDEGEYDGALSTVLDILKRTHGQFFDNACKDVRSVLKLVREETGHSNPTKKVHKPPHGKTGDGQIQINPLTAAAMFPQNQFYYLSDITT